MAPSVFQEEATNLLVDLAVNKEPAIAIPSLLQVTDAKAESVEIAFEDPADIPFLTATRLRARNHTVREVKVGVVLTEREKIRAPQGLKSMLNHLAHELGLGGVLAIADSDPKADEGKLAPILVPLGKINGHDNGLGAIPLILQSTPAEFFSLLILQGVPAEFFPHLTPQKILKEFFVLLSFDQVPKETVARVSY